MEDVMIEIIDLIDINIINNKIMRGAVKLFSGVSIVSTPDKNSVSRILDNCGKIIAVGWLGSDGIPNFCPVNLDALN
jgi:hypothetical protein